MRNQARAVVLGLARLTGRYRDWTPAEKRTKHLEIVSLQGDVPSMAGGQSHQRRLVFDAPRPRYTTARNVLYTRRGMAWLDGTLERRYSFQEVGPPHIFESPGSPTRTYSRATILQAQTPYTYGDWMSEHVAALSAAALEAPIVEPLLLPEHWFAKPYVRRDLQIMGIRAESLDATVLIGEASVINKTRHSHFWTRAEVEAVLVAMKITPERCEPGSAIYLSRAGERGEGPTRSLNNALTEAAMRSSGVRVVRSRETTPEAYKELAKEAETLFFDHGSAMYNMLHWKTRRVVELHSPEYWDPSFLMLADGLGINDYHVWQIGGDTTEADLITRIRGLRAPPIRLQEPPGR